MRNQLFWSTAFIQNSEYQKLQFRLNKNDFPNSELTLLIRIIDSSLSAQTYLYLNFTCMSSIEQHVLDTNAGKQLS